MPRPKICRCIKYTCKCNYFKPVSVPMKGLEEIKIRKDEVESLRLHDLEEMTQKEAAKQMKVSQPTFNRILMSARKKVSEALVKGKAIRMVE